MASLRRRTDINFILKSDFAAHVTMEGWQLHLKAYRSWKTPTEKHLEDNYQQNKIVVLQGIQYITSW